MPSEGYWTVRFSLYEKVRNGNLSDYKGDQHPKCIWDIQSVVDVGDTVMEIDALVLLDFDPNTYGVPVCRVKLCAPQSKTSQLPDLLQELNKEKGVASCVWNMRRIAHGEKITGYPMETGPFFKL